MINDNTEYIVIPVLPLRDVVIFPNMIMTLFVGRKKSIKCLETSEQKQKILLVAQKEADIENPSIKDIFLIGTISNIIQIFKLPDGTFKVIVEGLMRAKIIKFFNNEDYFTAEANILKENQLEKKEQEILIRTIIKQFEGYLQLNNDISIEILSSLKKMDNLILVIDTITANISAKLPDKQSILEIQNINERVEFLMTMIETEIDVLKIEQSIRNRVKTQMDKSQKEYYLNEQIKAIQKELTNLEDYPDEYENFKNKLNFIKMPKEARKKTEIELNKFRMMSPISAEATVVRSYIDWMLSLPWYTTSKIKNDLTKALQILDQDHYGLPLVKERILEYLAVQSRNKKTKGPILCLVGPPGVGKTSLGKSIAKATNRKFVRMSLGGVRDEAEIRGHRKTYIGSMPGKIIQNLSKIGVKNPLFLLDEIDKISYDLKGDPSSALLEVLDPEQNVTFNDHYLEVDFDLSDIMFVATSNTVNISPPLLDRMEVIFLSSYTEEEKFNIAKKHLLPKQLYNNALKNNEFFIKDSALIDIIRYYTREAGVRSLEREISKLCRKTVKKLLINKNIKSICIDNNNLSVFLGIKKFSYGHVEKENKIGKVTGLAWTESGGDLLNIETACVTGKGQLTYTGSLGEVMQESIQTALTVVRTRTNKLGINCDFYEKHDIHVHVPEGAIPKEGPSAGIAICTAIVSSLTNNPVISNIAMTGEITLCGYILPIGGLKEKIIAAHRAGIKKVLIPDKNKKNLEEISSIIINNLDIKLIKNIDEVLTLSLKNYPFIK